MREEILKNRNLLEGNFIGSMLKDLTGNLIVLIHINP